MSNLIERLRNDILDLLILKLLSEGDMCGHEIVEAIEENSDRYFQINESTIYPILYKLEEQGVATNYWNKISPEKAIPRKYYTITEKGKKVLRTQLIEWDLFLKGALPILSESKEN